MVLISCNHPSERKNFPVPTIELLVWIRIGIKIAEWIRIQVIEFKKMMITSL
jgi:hypothetical protein